MNPPPSSASSPSCTRTSGPALLLMREGESMLTHPTLERLRALKLSGMARALSEQLELLAAEALPFLERLGLLVDREQAERASRSLTTRLHAARLREQACLEDLDLRAPRGLDRGLILSLAAGDWVRKHRNVLI